MVGGVIEKSWDPVPFYVIGIFEISKILSYLQPKVESSQFALSSLFLHRIGQSPNFLLNMGHFDLAPLGPM